jgi:hypothetical protein
MMNKTYAAFFIILSVVFFASCIKDSTWEPEIACDPQEPYAVFQVVDKVSGTDLFFGTDARYKLNQLYAFKSTDKKHTDTIKPKIFSTATERVFLLPLNLARSADTLILKIADTPEDLLVYTSKPSGGVCQGHTLNKIFFNTVELQPSAGKFLLKK